MEYSTKRCKKCSLFINIGRKYPPSVLPFIIKTSMENFKLITLICLLCCGVHAVNAQVAPLTLQKYTFPKKIKTAKLTSIVVPSDNPYAIELSGKDAMWLSLKNKDIILKTQYTEPAVKAQKIEFSVRLKKGNKIVVEKAFTLIADEFLKNKVVAHRGAWKAQNLPQNSIASLKHAIQLGCEGSEFDAHLTADSVLVINHDPTFFEIPIQKSSLSTLQTKELSNGESIPLLKDFINIAQQQRATKLVLEIKPSVMGKEWALITARKAVQLVHDMQAQAWVDYICFDYDMVKEILRVDPMAHVQYLNGDKSPQELKKDGIAGADYHFSVFQNKDYWIAEAKKLGLVINTWTVNDPKMMTELLVHGVDIITTNEPEILFQQLAKLPQKQGWQLAWSDEFNHTGLPENTKWDYDMGGEGWGNNESQYYTRADTSNVYIKNGILSITAQKNKRDKNNYTSARLVTRGKASWLYGRIEVSAKLPAGRGIWPAIWMLGDNIKEAGWPRCGEIDIMENVGFNPDSIFCSVHTQSFNHVKGTQKTNGIRQTDSQTNFHLYAIEWHKEDIQFFVDDIKVLLFKNTGKGTEEWPFDKKFHLLLNVAVGGNWGGQKGIDETIFPATMEVDYVRVFKKK